MLESLAKKYGTDKFQNGYINHYEFHFGEIRDKIKSILEIGVLGGASLRMWRDYFPNASVVGVDINQGSVFKEDRIVVEWGNIADSKCINRLEAYGAFDIIIDDASHLSSQQIWSLDHLWPLVSPGGWFVMEDLGTQVRGGKYPGYIDQPRTMLDHLGIKIDELNRETTNCKEMHFYRWLCFMKKGQSK